MSTGGVRIGVDVGGTKILAAVVSSDGVAGPLASAATPSPAEGVAALEGALTVALEAAAAGRTVTAIGLAAAGFVDVSRERVRFAPHLAWRDDDVRARLSRRWHAPVHLDNDANCAALAEAEWGAARGAGSALMITLGTGIGGAVLIGGRLWRGASGMAGEFGHRKVVRKGRDCPCGLTGCWEQYCSGRALERAVGKRRAGSGWSGPDITAAARAGDDVACAAFADVGRWLGIGVAGLVASFDPERVVIGGGVSAAGDLLLDPAREALDAHLVGRSHRTPPPLVGAAAGARAGLLGATLLD